MKKLTLLSFLTLFMTTSLSAGKLDLSDKHIVNEEIAPYSNGVPVSKIVRQVTIMDEDERKDIDTLILSINPFDALGLREVSKKLLPLLPNLKYLDLSYDTIEKEGLEDVLLLLKTYPSLQYVNLDGNEVASSLPEFLLMEGKKDEDLKDQVLRKIIVYPQSLVESKSFLPAPLGRFPEWRATHRNFYQFQETY